MKLLYIVRHGIASDPGSAGIPDDQRPLTAKGIRRMRRIGRGLHRLRVRPDRILSSPLARARQSAEILASALRLSEHVELAAELLPGRSSEEIRAWLASRQEARLLIVGHNPGLQSLVEDLLSGTAGIGANLGEFRKGAIAAFRTDSGGVPRLEWFASPRILRGVGI